MFKNQRGIATILGLLLIGLMIGVITLGAREIQNPVIFGSRASDKTVPSVHPSPSPTQMPTMEVQGPCDAGQLICFDKEAAEVLVEQGRNARGTNWIAPGFILHGQGRKGFILSVAGLPKGISLDTSEGIFENNQSFNVNVAVDKQTVKSGVYEGEVRLGIGGNTAPGYKMLPYKLDLRVNFSAIGAGNLN